MITVIAGGVGAAKFLRGLIEVIPQSEINVIVNIGDDDYINGLYVTPDIDSIIYTCSDSNDSQRGWGLTNETWHAMNSLRKISDANSSDVAWFNLGDQDLGTHLYRTTRLRQGYALDQISNEICKAFNLSFNLIPASNVPNPTFVKTKNSQMLSFQEYFVKHHHNIEVEEICLSSDVELNPCIEQVLENSEKIIIAPSNPYLSIDPILKINNMANLLSKHRHRTIAISPIIGGKAIKGPAADLMRDLHLDVSCTTVAQHYFQYISTMVIDFQDVALQSKIESLGLKCLVTNTLMDTVSKSSVLASECLDL